MALSSYYKQLVEQRRELHQWPELGWTEFTTTNYLADKGATEKDCRISVASQWATTLIDMKK